MIPTRPPLYDSSITASMEAELTHAGFTALRTADATNKALSAPGTALVVVNSVCGCAAGAARPSVLLALSRTKKKPAQLLTVFAGVDHEAVDAVRAQTAPYPPSSPCIALFKAGVLAHFIAREQIEGNDAETIASHLLTLLEEIGDA